MKHILTINFIIIHLKGINPRGNSFTFYQPIKNLSNVKFSSSELLCIQKNCSSNFKYSNKKFIIDTSIVDSEYIIRKKDENLQPVIRSEICKVLNRFSYNTSIPYSTSKPILDVINKISQNNLIVQKADKVNILVIDSRDNITNKTMQFLSDPNFTQLKSDPTSMSWRMVSLSEILSLAPQK